MNTPTLLGAEITTPQGKGRIVSVHTNDDGSTDMDVEFKDGQIWTYQGVGDPVPSPTPEDLTSVPLGSLFPL